MTNFNTNQTRNFYVALAVDSSHAVDSSSFLAGSIALKQTATDELFFIYKNKLGMPTRTDSFGLKSIKCVNIAAADEKARKLLAHSITVNDGFSISSALVGKVLTCSVTIHEAFDYDQSNSITAVASVIGDSTNTASASAFYKDLAFALAKALPTPDPSYPLYHVFLKKNDSSFVKIEKGTDATSITGTFTEVDVVEGVQKYVRGKLSGEPASLSLSFSLHNSNIEDIVWGKDTVAPSAVSGYTVVPANYMLSDLEYFALGERGDVYRGGLWPNDIDHSEEYFVNAKSATAYKVLSIEYFWSGDAENVQKSPRLLQIAAPVTGSGSAASCPADDLYDALMAIINGSGSGSGNGA